MTKKTVKSISQILSELKDALAENANGNSHWHFFFCQRVVVTAQFNGDQDGDNFVAKYSSDADIDAPGEI